MARKLKPRKLKQSDVETLRGAAALAVIFYHFLLAFLPPAQAPDFADATGFVVHRPFVLAFINGPFMVSIFFVLSSYALTARMLETRAPLKTVIALAKRFPRLFPLTLVGALFPALLGAAGLMFNRQAAALNGSVWLERSGGVKLGAQWAEPSVTGGLIDSVMLFMRGSSQYNSALWTMKYELFGSLLAIVFAFMIAGRKRPWIDAGLTILMGLIALKIHPLCTICVVTVSITKYSDHWRPALSGKACLALVTGGFLLGCTYKSIPPELLSDDWLRGQVPRANWVVHGAGAMMIFLGVRGWTKGDWQGTRWGDLLGRLSFSVYVLHIPVQGSLACGIVLFLGYSWLSVLAAFLISTAVIYALAVPLSRFDGWWVGKLNSFARQFDLGGKSAAAAG